MIADVRPGDRERAVRVVADVLGRSYGRDDEDVASDVIDDLGSAGFRLIEGWLPGEHEELIRGNTST